MSGLVELKQKSGIFVRKGSEHLVTHGLVFVCFLVSFILAAKTVLAQDLHGKPLPNSIPQEVYERVLGNDPTDPVDGCFAHWAAAGFGVDAWVKLMANTPSAPVYQAPIETPSTPSVTCDSTKSWRSDGSLWKPVSDKGAPVILFPCAYNSAVEIAVFDVQKAKKYAVRSRNYCRNPNGANPDGRSHFDVPSVRASEMGGNAIVAITLLDGSVECRQLPNPSQRYE